MKPNFKVDEIHGASLQCLNYHMGQVIISAEE